MNKLIKINNFREKYSSHSNIFNPEGSEYYFCKYVNNNKIININNFDLKIKNKKIKYSTYYTNPFVLDNKIISKINFYSNKNTDLKVNKYKHSHTDLLDKFFIEKNKLTRSDKIYIETIICKKKFNSNYICLEETFLIMLYLIKYDKNIKDKNNYFDLLNFYWLKFKLGNFDVSEIINSFIYANSSYKTNTNNDLITDKIKFYISFYILFEEFHLKYITIWLNLNKMVYNQENIQEYTDYQKNYLNDNKNKFILNSNYVKINPQEILNNYGGEYYTNISNLLELVQIPLGHNILFIFNFNKVYYYDSDEQDLCDIYKLNQLFNQIGFKFTNISNRKPIQTIIDDGNCLFFCLRLVQYIFESDIKINLDTLKTNVLVYEKKILNSNDMYNWIKNFV